MKIIVTGLRGFPDIQGGIETHCEELYPRLSDLGCDINVVRRSCYVHEDPRLTSFKNVKFKDINTSTLMGLEAVIHTLKGILYAFKQQADIVHIHGIGPSVVIPFAKLLGLKIVVTHHGPDYNRAKWGKFARFILKTGEFLAVRMADEIIVISTVIDAILKDKYHCTNTHLIYNGVNQDSKPPQSTRYLEELDLKKEKYILAVGRFVEEKGFDKLINAFISISDKDMKLVIAGDADHETFYSCQLKKMAAEHHIVQTGMIKGAKLQELYANASLFVLPSSHEGLPITLLEAMSYNRNVLVSNIPANLAVNLPDDCYYQLNDHSDLINQLTNKINERLPERKYDLTSYNWNHIAQQTLDVYKKVMSSENSFSDY